MKKFLDAQESIFETAQHYAIADAVEARTYLNHQILGPRLFECTEALLAIEGSSANEIFGFPDDMKLKSSMTLFEAVRGHSRSIFTKVLGKYFAERCSFTLKQLDAEISD